jgi:hypothetical protein
MVLTLKKSWMLVFGFNVFSVDYGCQQRRYYEEGQKRK